MGNQNQKIIKNPKERLFQKDKDLDFFYPLKNDETEILSKAITRTGSIFLNNKKYIINSGKIYFVEELQKPSKKENDSSFQKLDNVYSKNKNNQSLFQPSRLSVIDDTQNTFQTTADYLFDHYEIKQLNSFIDRDLIIRPQRYFSIDSFKYSFIHSISDYYDSMSVLNLDHMFSFAKTNVCMSKLFNDFLSTSIIVPTSFKLFFEAKFVKFLNEEYLDSRKITYLNFEVLIKEMLLTDLDMLGYKYNLEQHCKDIKNLYLSVYSNKEEFYYQENINTILKSFLSIINDESKLYYSINEFLVSYSEYDITQDIKSFIKLYDEIEGFEVMLLMFMIIFCLKANGDKQRNEEEKFLTQNKLYKVVVFEKNESALFKKDSDSLFEKKISNVSDSIKSNTEVFNGSININNENSKNKYLFSKEEIKEASNETYNNTSYNSNEDKANNNDNYPNNNINSNYNDINVSSKHHNNHKYQDEQEKNIKYNKKKLETNYFINNQEDNKNDQNDNNNKYSFNNNPNNYQDYSFFEAFVKSNSLLQVHTLTSFTSNLDSIKNKQDYFINIKSKHKYKTVFFELLLNNNFGNSKYFPSTSLKTIFSALDNEEMIFHGEDEVMFAPFSTFKIKSVEDNFIDKVTNMKYDLKVSLLLIEESFPNFGENIIYWKCSDVNSNSSNSKISKNIHRRIKSNKEINNMINKTNANKFKTNFNNYTNYTNCPDTTRSMESSNKIKTNLLMNKSILSSKNQNILKISSAKEIESILEEKLLSSFGTNGFLSYLSFSHSISTFKIEMTSTLSNIFLLTNLEYLHLQDNKLNSNLTSMLGKNLPLISNLRHLNLKNNEIGKEFSSYSSIAYGLKSLKFLEYLNLENSCLDDEAFKHINEIGLKDLLLLITLNISNNTIENELKSLSNNFKNYIYLENLLIAKNGFSLISIKSFFNLGVVKSLGTSLKSLDLSDITASTMHLDSEAMFKIISHLKFFPLLESLNISNNKLSESSASIEFFNLLFTELTNLCFLKELNLSFMEVPFLSMLDLVKAISKLKNLEVLYLYDIKMRKYDDNYIKRKEIMLNKKSNIYENGVNLESQSLSRVKTDIENEKSFVVKRETVLEVLRLLYKELEKLENFVELYLNVSDFSDFDNILEDIDEEYKFIVYINEI